MSSFTTASLYKKNTCDGASFLIKLKAIRPVALLKRDSNRYFLVNFGKFIRTPILKKKKQRMAAFLESVMSEHFFRSELSKRKF